ncbi:class I SAM-dependent methyltransferase [bacterium]
MSKAHRDYFNALASEWSSRMPDDSHFRELLIQFGVTEGDRVLDTGAGTGRMTKHLIDLVGIDGQVVAQDFALKMVQEGQANLIHSSVYWVCDDLCSMGLQSNYFNKVLCFSVFPHLQDPGLVLNEIYRVLQPGGKLLILHVSGRDQLNAFHASLEGVVQSDRLPSSEDILAYFRQAEIDPVTIVDQDNLYWAEGRKPFR